MSDYKLAETLYKQAIEIKRNLLGEEDRDYANSLMNLGVLYLDMGDYKSAEPLYKQSLNIYKKAFRRRAFRLCEWSNESWEFIQ